MTDPFAEFVALHRAHHARLEELLLQCIEGLMAVDLAVARARFDVFARELEQGLALEDDVIMPAYRGLPTHAPQGRPDVVEGDHVILRRSLTATQELLDALEALAPEHRRRAIAVHLPTVHRLLGVLEHHGAREDQHVYPATAPTLTTAALQAATATLQALTAIESGPPSR
jgi:hypothetical protein